ncbi:hypothetical protein H920_07365 [Fukomys damarensis]|uniref:Uncharacterized protein n=1 Tax=Fukomys damarensis TaxID=885580 RepID=A0A091DLD8_FUKDA|nr:hypothetical protein H920_07365 [Fukomys damarensis]
MGAPLMLLQCQQGEFQESDCLGLQIDLPWPGPGLRFRVAEPSSADTFAAAPPHKGANHQRENRGKWLGSDISSPSTGMDPSQRSEKPCLLLLMAPLQPQVQQARPRPWFRVATPYAVGNAIAAPGPACKRSGPIPKFREAAPSASDATIAAQVQQARCGLIPKICEAAPSASHAAIAAPGPASNVRFEEAALLRHHMYLYLPGPSSRVQKDQPSAVGVAITATAPASKVRSRESGLP